MCSLRFKVIIGIFNHFPKSVLTVPFTIQGHMCTLVGVQWPEDGYCWGQGMLRWQHLLDDEGWQAATMTMEDEAQRATMQLLGGGGGEGRGLLRGGNRHCGGLLYHLGVGCHVGVFQGIDGAHYTVLTVVGGRLGRERRHSK